MELQAAFFRGFVFVHGRCVGDGVTGEAACGRGIKGDRGDRLPRCRTRLTLHHHSHHPLALYIRFFSTPPSYPTTESLACLPTVSPYIQSSNTPNPTPL